MKERLVDMGVNFTLDETSQALALGGVSIHWTDYSLRGGGWDEDSYYADFDAWWRSLTEGERERIWDRMKDISRTAAAMGRSAAARSSMVLTGMDGSSVARIDSSAEDAAAVIAEEMMSLKALQEGCDDHDLSLQLLRDEIKHEILECAYKTVDSIYRRICG